MFYNRQFGGGISEYENQPNNLLTQIGLRFDIANAVAYRNTTVTDGSDNTIDRRLAVSQNSIYFEIERDQLNIGVLYIPYLNYENFEQITIPLGVFK
jgi:hypothetical protein